MMKTCSYCENKYMDALARCPRCGSMSIMDLDTNEQNQQKRTLDQAPANRGKAKEKSHLLATLILAAAVFFLVSQNKGNHQTISESSYQAVSESSQQTVSEPKMIDKSADSVPSANEQPIIEDTVDLTSLNPYYEGKIQVIKNGITDTLGNHYRSGLRGYIAPGDVDRYKASCFNIWDIGGEFKKLTAKGIIRESDKGSPYTGSYRIYGDGKLLYQRDEIGSMTKPYDIEVDVSGVTDLKIEMYGNGNAGTSGINSVLVDIQLHR